MYTGIITDKRPVVSIKEQNDLKTLTLTFTEKLLVGLETSASVSVAGVCLTVTNITDKDVSFDIMQETLDKTTLGELQVGDVANVERSAQMNAEVGGHAMAGHVFGTGKIVQRDDRDSTCSLTVSVPHEWMKYILQKGYIGLDGASLTVNDPSAQEGTFVIHLIPETLAITTFNEKKVGDKLNVEIDYQTQTVVDTVERVLNAKHNA